MIYFIRHGESEANLKHVFAGQKDNSPLTKKGIEQAKAEGLKIKEMALNIDDDRINSFLREWNTYNGNVLMVAHAGVGRIIETIKINTDPELFYDLPPYPNASVIKLDWLK